MDSLSPLDNLQYLSAMPGSMYPQPPTPPAPHPAPGPQPAPTPQPPEPPLPPPSPLPDNNGVFVDFVQSLTPAERAGATPTAMQLENLEMAKNYQQDYEDAMAANGTSSSDNGNSTTSTSDDNGGLSSPDFYADMYKDSKAMSVNQWTQEHLYQLENLDTLSGQYSFNTAVVVNAGAANGMRIPPGFMSDPAYQAASGGAGPLAGATDGAGAAQALGDYFSPQSVARRSVDMMVGMYGGQPGDQTARQGYAGTMRAMTERAYEQSRGQIAGSNLDARSALSQTSSLIGQGLDDFARNGPDPAKSQPGGLYDQLRVYANDGRTSYEPGGQSAAPENLLGGVPSLINTQA